MADDTGETLWEREVYVQVTWPVILMNGETHIFPAEDWARWFASKHHGAAVGRPITTHTYQGLHGR